MNASILIKDVIKWVVVTAVMLVVTFYTFIGAFYIFEFILVKLMRFNTLLYLFFWSFALAIAVPTFTYLVSVVASYAMALVRQKKWFGNLFGTLYLICIVAVLIAFWASLGQFGWENSLPHQTLNKWLFTIFMLGLLGIPMKIAESYAYYVKAQADS